jgi:hypothetical protein
VPFTLAHPAAVLLLRRTSFPVAAMVVGATSPDLPVYFDAYGTPYNYTHSALGVLTADLVIGVVGLVIWLYFLRDPIVDVLPVPVRERLLAQARYTRAQWRLVVPAVVAGSTTHVVWDLFTHRDRWGVRHIAWLHEKHGQLVGFHWTQYGSSVLGLTVCVLWACRYVAAQGRQPHPVRVQALGTRALSVVGVITLASGLAAGIFAPDPGIRMFVSQTAVVGTIIGGLALVLLASLWHFLLPRKEDDRHRGH